ncbi:MAG: hypothetical protein QM527_13825 [Alphaproteobacteria bacterium]|nr:hypothetical protein [Alphaproteobacteria bacterium]
MATSQRPPSPGLTPHDDTDAGAARRKTLAQLRALGYASIPKAPPLVRGRAVSAAQAAIGSGVLGSLWRQAQEAQNCLAQLRSVLPAPLLSQVQSGPIEGGEWTLLVGHSAAAAKIRQWVPALAAHVRSKGWPVERIVVKVQQK